MSEGSEETKQSPSPDTSKDKGEGAFTPEQQKAIDRIVSQRVNETKAKYDGFEAFREKAQIFDNMMDDERFQKFIGKLEDKGDEPGIDPSDIKGFEDLRRYDPEIASAVERIIEDVRKQDKKLYESEVKKLMEPMKREFDDVKVQRVVQEVEKMKSDVENYPHMQSEEFQATMASLLTTDPKSGRHLPRASSLEDAYDLATVQWTRQGKDLPKSPSQLKQAKRDAELLEDRGGGGGTGPTDEPPPKFKNAREAAEHAMKKLGWM